MDLVLKKSRSPIYLQSAQRLSNSPKLILDSSDIDNNNQNPHVFVWTAPVERIMNKIAECKEALEALH